MRESHRQEVEIILKEKHEEVEKIKLEAERTTGGVRKLYQSLQVGVVIVMLVKILEFEKGESMQKLIEFVKILKIL